MYVGKLLGSIPVQGIELKNLWHYAHNKAHPISLCLRKIYPPSHPFPLPPNKTEIYFYIICGRVFSYSSSDANNTYIITDQYMMDGSYSSDLLKL